MQNKYISIVSTSSADRRQSTLVMEEGGALTVMGNLPHNYTFKPSTPVDAIRLADHITQAPSAPFEVRKGDENCESTKGKFYVVRAGAGLTHADGKCEYLTIDGKWEKTCFAGWFNNLTEIGIAFIRLGTTL